MLLDTRAARRVQEGKQESCPRSKQSQLVAGAMPGEVVLVDADNFTSICNGAINTMKGVVIITHAYSD
jgi:hypothetical protein